MSGVKARRFSAQFESDCADCGWTIDVGSRPGYIDDEVCCERCCDRHDAAVDAQRNTSWADRFRGDAGQSDAPLLAALVIGLLGLSVLLLMFTTRSQGDDIRGLERQVEALTVEVEANREFAERLKDVLDSQGSVVTGQADRLDTAIGLLEELLGAEPDVAD